MSKLLTLSSVLSLILALFLAGNAQTTAFTYQGRLTDGASPANGNYDLTLQLFDAAIGGNLLGSNAIPSVAVANGVFTVSLDYGQNPFGSGANRFLEISVKRVLDPTFTTLAPRQQLTSSPYAIQSLSATLANGLSPNCVACVTDAQINSISGNKVTGTVSNAVNATTAINSTTATTATSAGNVTGIVAIANGGTGSATKSFVDLSTPQTIAGAKTFSGNLRTAGLTRTGSEAGTSEIPVIDPGIDTYNGTITRRVNSTAAASGQVVARTNVLRLERDGSFGGWQISYPALGIGLEISQSVHCLGINNLGVAVPARIQLSGNAAGSTPLFSDLQNIEYFQCTMGNDFNAGHQTQVTLQRFTGDFFWVGTVTSTFNQ